MTFAFYLFTLALNHMNDQTIREIVEELRAALVGRAWGKMFQLSRAALAIDFRTNDGRYLFISATSDDPRLYMMASTVRELEKASLQPQMFVLTLRKYLGGAILRSVSKDEGDRIVRFVLIARDVVGDEMARTFVAQLTGRTANLLLLDAEGRIVDTLRSIEGAGQEIGELYAAPVSSGASAAHAAHVAPIKSPFGRAAFSSLSEAADDYYRRLEKSRAFDARVGASLARIRQAIDKRRKLLRNLARDLAAHGDAEEHRRIGELLHANISNAERSGSRVRLNDYYAEGAPVVEFEIDENRSLQEEAAHRFARYTKAKRAAQEITQRLTATEQELSTLEHERGEMEEIAGGRDEAALEALESETKSGERATKRRGVGQNKRDASKSSGSPQGQANAPQTKSQKGASIPGVRRYRSSDGHEILVGRGARDNDQLTFRLARSFDLWLHAADYPGSHVIVRNQARESDVPHRTIIEAAQLAAHFSQASKDSKVAVNYTPRKFVSKPKGAAHGLVRLSSFRTILVEPRESIERI